MTGHLRRMLKLRQVQELIPYSVSQIYALMAEKKFPRQAALGEGGRSVGWFEDELIAHQEKIAAERDRLAALAAGPRLPVEAEVAEKHAQPQNELVKATQATRARSERAAVDNS